MSLATEVFKVQYNTNGSATVFGIPFTTLNEQDILVTILLDTESKENEKVLTTDYTIDANRTNVTMLVAPENGVLTVSRRNRKIQNYSWPVGGPFSEESLNDGLDFRAMTNFEVWERLGRCMELQINDDDSADMRLPLEADRASNLLGFNSDGEPVAIAGTTSVNVTAYMETLLDDADSAEARATLEVNLNTIQALASIATVDVNLNLPASPAIGDMFFCRWSAGDGSNQAVLVASGSHVVRCGGKLLDATALARFGEGTGSAVLRYIATNLWNVDSLYDTDDGNFTGTFTKFADGRLLMQRTVSDTVDLEGVSGGLFTGPAETYNLPLTRISTSLDEIGITPTTSGAPMCQLDAGSATQYDVKYWRGATEAAATVGHVMQAVSTWY
ncbi:hypothetical protein KAR91_47330 [Candidatus Pacearchaeota archaeon]|nr:hypothetical protein [Candidatus Pacearchaeota archaeon]